MRRTAAFPRTRPTHRRLVLLFGALVLLGMEPLAAKAQDILADNLSATTSSTEAASGSTSAKAIRARRVPRRSLRTVLQLHTGWGR